MIKIIHLGENIKEVTCPFYCFTSGVYDNILHVTGNVNLDTMVKMVSARFLYCKVSH